MITRKLPLLTLETKLKDIPEGWLHWIEKHVRRQEDGCWIWIGAHDTDGEPVLNFYNPVTGKRNTRRVKRMIGEMFWTIHRGIDMVHQCKVLSCINPGHLRPEVSHWTQR